MNAKQLFLNISQILDVEDKVNPFPFVSDMGDVPHEEPEVHIATNHGSNISHITLEYYGEQRAKFFTCLVFDGSGDRGTDTNMIAMPRVKITMFQKALLALSVLDYLCARNLIDADFEFFRAKIAAGLNGGSNRILAVYDDMCRRSIDALADLQKQEQKIPF